MAKITIKEFESLTPNDAGRILREDGNLAGRISVRKDGVSVSFFYRYRWGDQNKEYACGTWPRKSLTDIRKARNQARATIDEQINPNEQKKTAKAQAYAAANVETELVKTKMVKTLTVQDLVKDWLLDGVARKDGNAELQHSFKKALWPALGKTAVSNVSEHDIRAVIRTVVNRGAHRQAISFFADLTQMFNWARKRQPWRASLIEGVPTELVDISPLIPASYEADNELATDASDGFAVVFSEVGDRLEVRHQTPGKPHQFDVALGFSLQSPTRLNAVQIAVDIGLQQDSRMVSRPASTCRHGALKPSLNRSSSSTKNVDYAHRIGIRDVIVEALWKEGALASMLTLDKALHGRSLR